MPHTGIAPSAWSNGKHRNQSAWKRSLSKIAFGSETIELIQIVLATTPVISQSALICVYERLNGVFKLIHAGSENPHVTALQRPNHAGHQPGPQRVLRGDQQYLIMGYSRRNQGHCVVYTHLA